MDSPCLWDSPGVGRIEHPQVCKTGRIQGADQGFGLGGSLKAQEASVYGSGVSLPHYERGMGIVFHFWVSK